MSASEKLRALATNYVTVTDPAVLVRALPQIVAVVEIAHGIAETDAPLWGTRDGLGFKMQDALAALDEALS